jgi:hypothetical protein
MAIIPSQFVRDHAPWSISKAEVARQCPKKFFLQYVDKVKTGQGSNSAARIGKAVHTAMEYILKGNPVAQAFRLAASVHELLSDEINTINDYIPAAKKFMAHYKNYCVQHRAQPPEVELKLAVDINGKPVRFFDNANCFLRGVIDLAVQFKGRSDVLIIDHKTGAEKEFDHFKHQFAAYQLLIKARYPALQAAYVGLNYLGTDKVVLLPTPFSLKEIDPLMDSVVQFLNDATADADNFEMTRCGPLCNWCEYKASGDCPIYQVTNGKTEE